jgi:23S rRNA-/tRNA-specific pseudouridylate synthase
MHSAGVSVSKKKLTTAADPSQDREQDDDSLHELVHQYFARNKKVVSKAYPASHLDNKISGIVVFAKNQETLRTLKSSWHANGICVVCVSKGVPRPATGIFGRKTEKQPSINIRYRVISSKKGLKTMKGQIY